MNIRLGRTRGWADSPPRGWMGSLAVLVVCLILYFVMTPGATSISAPTNIVNSSVVIALAAVGEGIIVLSGGFDLSVGSVISLLNVVLATHFAGEGHNPVIALLVACLVGGLCGLANGALVVLGRIPTVIATLGTSFVFSGLALYFLSQPGGEVSTDFARMLTGSTEPLPYSAVVIVAVLLVWQYVRGRPLGQALYAVGADSKCARLSGVSVGRTLFAAYAASGICYGLAAACLTAQTTSGDPRIGDPLTLTVFAAVVVGGVRLGGGEGSIASAVTGAFILGLISDLLYSAGVSSFYYYVVTGVVLVVAVAVSGVLATTSVTGLLARRRGHPGDVAERNDDGMLVAP